MFLPNTDSFILIRRTAVKPSFPVFLPNTDSFVLKRGIIVKPGFTPEAGNVVDTIPQPTDREQTKVKDQGKRTFLKVASIAVVGVIASQLSPKKAQALIMGSSPTTGVVGVKNVANTRINPATEETVSSLLKPSDLTFDTGSLQVKVTSVSGDGSGGFSTSADETTKSALVDAERHVQVDVLSSALSSTVSTETTLQTISFGGFKFTIRLATDSGDSNIEYVGEAAAGTVITTNAWRIKRIDSTTGIVLEWAGTNPNFGLFDQVWDNREGLTYA